MARRTVHDRSRTRIMSESVRELPLAISASMWRRCVKRLVYTKSEVSPEKIPDILLKFPTPPAPIPTRADRATVTIQKGPTARRASSRICVTDHWSHINHQTKAPTLEPSVTMVDATVTKTARCACPGISSSVAKGLALMSATCSVSSPSSTGKIKFAPNELQSSIFQRSKKHSLAMSVQLQIYKFSTQPNDIK
ncbi:hypothetical protein RvY_12479-3 [Ramazzottius varieornatus]|uniref:Uncharacterized protein n=1 Tax=Ramazzottius varieornatus TaxID=947166 RepID=A0A1D1VS97_RAMVA|nr:hypothetical protein RvY_12479-3 [Ramazzottius varieornatus]